MLKGYYGTEGTTGSCQGGKGIGREKAGVEIRGGKGIWGWWVENHSLDGKYLRSKGVPF